MILTQVSMRYRPKCYISLTKKHSPTDGFVFAAVGAVSVKASVNTSTTKGGVQSVNCNSSDLNWIHSILLTLTAYCDVVHAEVRTIPKHSKKCMAVEGAII